MKKIGAFLLATSAIHYRTCQDIAPTIDAPVCILLSRVLAKLIDAGNETKRNSVITQPIRVHQETNNRLSLHPEAYNIHTDQYSDSAVSRGLYMNCFVIQCSYIRTLLTRAQSEPSELNWNELTLYTSRNELKGNELNSHLFALYCPCNATELNWTALTYFSFQSTRSNVQATIDVTTVQFSSDRSLCTLFRRNWTEPKFQFILFSSVQFISLLSLCRKSKQLIAAGVLVN